MKDLTDSADRVYKIAHDDIKERAHRGLKASKLIITKTFEASQKMTEGADTSFLSSTSYSGKRHLESLKYRHGYAEAVNKLHELKNTINKVKQA